MKRFIVFALLALATHTATAQAYKIYDTRKAAEVSFDDMMAGLKTAYVVFFGEDHQDSTGHVLEQMVLKSLHQAHGEKLALSLEMFETDVQLVLDEYLAGLIKDKNLVTEGRAWPNYKDYRPLVDYCKENKLRVIAANTPKRYANAVTPNGLEVLNRFDKRAKQWLPRLPIDTAAGRYYEKFMEVMGEHSSPATAHIYHTQNLWDATMAWSIVTNILNAKISYVMHVCGHFHSDEKLGTVQQFMNYAAKLDKWVPKVMNISCYPDETFANPDWSKHATMGDYVILLPKKEDKKN
jgi:Uncharacterized iron-regulated protein